MASDQSAQAAHESGGSRTERGLSALARALVAAGPIAYFAWLLARQVWGDWQVLTDPRPDLETALSFAAVAYLGLLLLT